MTILCYKIHNGEFNYVSGYAATEITGTSYFKFWLIFVCMDPNNT